MAKLEGDNGFGGHYINGYTKLHSGSQWNEQPTNGTQIDLVYLKQSFMTSFGRTRKTKKRRLWNKYE
jgi:hypothetical protein